LTRSKNSLDESGEHAPAVGVASYAKGAAKRDEILTGLMRKLAAQELRNPSLREIGRALGIQPAHILYYFGSREDLLQAVILRWDEDARSRDDRSDLTLGRFVRQIERNLAIPGIVHLYLTFAAEAVDPEHPAHDFFRQRFLRVRASLAERIRKEQEDGTISADLDADSQARQLIALADGLQLQSLVDPGVNAANDLNAAIRALRVHSQAR